MLIDDSREDVHPIRRINGNRFAGGGVDGVVCAACFLNIPYLAGRDLERASLSGGRKGKSFKSDRGTIA